MATIEYEGVMSYVNENGDVLELYPKVKTDTTLSESGKPADAKAVKEAIDNLQTDNTLTESGKPADAKAVGDKITSLTGQITSFENTKSEIVGSGLGTALSLTASTTWANIVSKIKAITNRGAWNGSITTSGGNVTVPAGYHNGSGKVTGPTLANLVGSNVNLNNNGSLMSGVTAYGANGTKYTGSIANKGALNWSGSNTTYSVPAGYYSGGTLDSRTSYNNGYNAGVTAGGNNYFTLLWTNNAPTSPMGYDLKISCNLQNYAYILVSSRLGVNFNFYSSSIVPVGKTGMIIAFDTNKQYYSTRWVRVDTDGLYIYENGSWPASTHNSDNCIPYRIWGFNRLP